MTTPEGRIENYLHRRVRQLGGSYRRVRWVGRRSAPDDLIAIPGLFPFFVECKAPGEEARPAQLRERERLRKMGFKVFVVASEDEVDRILQ